MVRAALLLATTVASVSAADEPDAGGAAPDIADLSLEDLLETKVTVASATGATTSSAESPGIVTVITREEIHDLGARDLIDVLRFVPGFDFNNDVENSVGLSVRGIFALEGKALVLIDGMPYNDLEYGNALFGNRDAIDLIERIEIIRGPGSTVYGGFAELAVINIVTQPDVPVNRFIASTTYGQMPTAVGRATGSLLGSYRFGDLHVHATAFTGYSIRSDRPYGVATELVPMARYSAIRPLNLSVGASFKGFSAQLMYDDYAVDAPVPDDLSQPLHKYHRSLFAQLKYSKAVTDTVTVTAWARYLHQRPWEGSDAFDLKYGYYSDKRIHRAQLGANVILKPLDWLSVLAGVEGTYDLGIAVEHPEDPDVMEINYYADATGALTPQLTFFGVAGFLEATALTKVVNVTLGARVDFHSTYGLSFVPRIALTKEFGKFHAKALLSRAFRAPTFENISYFPGIKPENTTVIELEAGYQFLPGLYAGLNVFDNRVYGAIVYQEDGAIVSYVNAGTTGTHGLEVEVRARGTWGYAKLGYSFYEATVHGVTQYEVEGRPDLHLGIPAHRVTAHASFRVGEHLAINPAFIFYSERYGLEAALDGSDPVVTRFEATALVDLFVVLRDMGVKGFDVSFGVHDLLGSNYRYVPAYNAGVNAMPGPGTEVMLRLSYLRDFVE